MASMDTDTNSMKVIPVVEFHEDGSAEYIVEFIENDDKPDMPVVQGTTLPNAVVVVGTSSRKRQLDGLVESTTSTKAKKSDTDTKVIPRAGVHRKIVFGDIMEKLLEAGWRELDKRGLGRAGAMLPAEKLWVRPLCVDKWVKDNPHNLQLNVHFFWSNDHVVDELQRSGQINNFLPDSFRVVDEVAVDLQSPNFDWGKLLIGSQFSDHANKRCKINRVYFDTTRRTFIVEYATIYGKSITTTSLLSTVLHLSQTEVWYLPVFDEYKETNSVISAFPASKKKKSPANIAAAADNSTSLSSDKESDHSDVEDGFSEIYSFEEDLDVDIPCIRRKVDLNEWRNSRNSFDDVDSSIDKKLASKSKRSARIQSDWSSQDESDYDDDSSDASVRKGRKEAKNNESSAKKSSTKKQTSKSKATKEKSSSDDLELIGREVMVTGNKKHDNIGKVARVMDHVGKYYVLHFPDGRTVEYLRNQFEVLESFEDYLLREEPTHHSHPSKQQRDYEARLSSSTSATVVKPTKEIIDVSSDDSSDENLAWDVESNEIVQPQVIYETVDDTGYDSDIIEDVRPKKELKCASQYDPGNILTPEDELQMILSTYREDRYFPFKYLLDHLFKHGWGKYSVPENVSKFPKYRYAYFPSWTNKVDGEGVKIYESVTGDFLEGRDYFYTNEDVLEYLQQFGNMYDSVGISAKFESLGRRSRSSGKSTSGLDVEQNKPKPKTPSLKKLKQEEKLSVWKQHLLEDGFICENAIDLYVGKRIRRFFFVGQSDGEVICFRPESADCGPMYGVVHDDGDTEVLDLIDIQRGYYDLNRGATQEPFDYKLYDENKSKAANVDLEEIEEAHSKEIEDLEMSHREKIRACREKTEEQVSEYFESKYKKLLEDMREKYKKRIDALEKRTEKYEKTVGDLRNQLKFASEQNEILNQTLEKVKYQQRAELIKLKKECGEANAKVRLEMQALSRSQSTSSAASNSSEVQVPSPLSCLKSSFTPSQDNSEYLLESWREYLLELCGGERTEKVVMITREPDASAYHSSGSTDLELDRYPVRITVDHFGKWTTKERLSAPLRVSFQHMETVEGRINSGVSIYTQGEITGRRVRQRLVKDAAYDAGGLFRQWIGDFFTALRSFVVPTDKLAPLYFDEDLEMFVFVTKGSRYLPPAVYIDREKTCTLSLDDERNRDKQGVFIMNLYLTVGKMINQVLREHTLPESFASPLLVYYLLGGSRGILHESSLSYKDIRNEILKFDPGYHGYLQYLDESVAETSELEKKTQLCNFVVDKIYAPRAYLLDVMKKGFDLVPIRSHLLSFTYQQIEKFFISIESVIASDIKESLVFEEELESDIMQTLHETIDSMSAEEIRQFLIFSTGMPFINPRKSTIQVYRFPFMPEDMVRWPVWPLPKSFTCFNKVMIPYVPGFTYQRAEFLENFKRAFEHNNSEFSDAIL